MSNVSRKVVGATSSEAFVVLFICSSPRVVNESESFRNRSAFGEVMGQDCRGTEADLGMFSVFRQTGAPTKKGPPQEDRQIFAT